MGDDNRVRSLTDQLVTNSERDGWWHRRSPAEIRLTACAVTIYIVPYMLRRLTELGVNVYSFEFVRLLFITAFALPFLDIAEEVLRYGLNTDSKLVTAVSVSITIYITAVTQLLPYGTQITISTFIFLFSVTLRCGAYANMNMKKELYPYSPLQGQRIILNFRSFSAYVLVALIIVDIVFVLYLATTL